MGCVRFSFHRISAQPLVEILQDAGAEKTSPASSLQVAGRCCEGAANFQSLLERQTAKALVRPQSKNSLECCWAATALFFADCSNERVSRSLGTSWDESIVDGKRAAKFAAVISLAASAGNNSQRRRPSVYCDPSEKCRRTTNWLRLSAADPLNLQGILTPGPRIAAFTTNRILFSRGLPIAALEAGEIRKLVDAPVSDLQIETALRIGKLPPSLRPYYK